MLKYLAILFLALALPSLAMAEPQGDCSSTPKDAVLELPTPLSEWASIVCTPYGHIISNHEGWIWTRPGGYSPVFIPSQMVRSNPKPIGNASYFTKVAFEKSLLTDPNTKGALAALQDGFPQEHASIAYKLTATGSLGRSLVLYFFQLGTSTWGIWCDKDGANCSSDTMFMVLDMRKGS